MFVIVNMQLRTVHYCMWIGGVWPNRQSAKNEMCDCLHVTEDCPPLHDGGFQSINQTATRIRCVIVNKMLANVTYCICSADFI